MKALRSAALLVALCALGCPQAIENVDGGNLDVDGVMLDMDVD